MQAERGKQSDVELLEIAVLVNSGVELCVVCFIRKTLARYLNSSASLPRVKSNNERESKLYSA